MTFFNQKQDVLELRLTNYGESQLAKGKLRPSYYSFSDEDVIYNFSSSAEELQNEIDGRIKLDTPYRKVQKNRFSNSRDAKAGNIVGVDFESEMAKMNSVGTCASQSSGSSALKVIVLGNEIEAFSNFYTSSGDQRVALPIPQIDVNIEFQSMIDRFGAKKTPFEVDDGLSEQDIFADGGAVYIASQEITLMIQEQNTSVGFENFEVEVFEIVEGEPNYLGDQPLRKLQFIKQEDDIRVDDKGRYIPEDEQRERNRVIASVIETTENVEYYFDVFTDTYNEIPDNLICSLVSEVKTGDFALDAELRELCSRDAVTISDDAVYRNGLPSSDDC